MKVAGIGSIVVLIVALLAAGVVSGPGEGPQGPPPGAPPPGPCPCPLIVALDANADKAIDAAEIGNAAAALRTLDKDGDGALQCKEFCPCPAAGKCPKMGAAGPGPGAGCPKAMGACPMGKGPKGPGNGKGCCAKCPLIGALDPNADKVIDAAEIDGASAALAKLDKNDDGALTPDEFCPPGCCGPKGPRGPKGPGGPGCPRAK